MTDALTKYTELQQLTNIEYERQRHLANWLMQSSIHMPDPGTNNSSGGGKKNSKNNKKASNKTSASPIIFLNKITNNLTSSKQQAPPATINSQTNLPLQIVAQRDGHKPKLRRFNSHDTSANMFSVADFENARLARRNELENASLMKQRNRYKMNSLSSGGDYSTGDSKGSKFSTDSISDPLPVEHFLDKFPLPRVVRLTYDENVVCTNTMTSFSSNESNNNNTTTSMEIEKTKPKNGDLLLLYRHLKDHKVYHLMNAKASSRKRGIKLPQDFQGYFSLVNERGASTACCYTSIVQLVRERVYKFLSVDTLTAYSESQTGDKPLSKSHYIKGTAKAGQVFRLLAVFQDGTQQDQSKPSSQSSTLNGREKERGRYAQLVGENRQIIYVSLSSKGKFYEIEHQTPQMMQVLKTNRQMTKPINPDCVHRISNIITPDTELPLNLKYISGPVGHNMIPETVTVHRVSRENLLIACPIDETSDGSVLQLRKIHVAPNMKLVKCFLGFENEQKMVSNPNVQNIFKFCQFNADDFARNVDVEPLPAHMIHSGTNRIKGESLKILNPLTKLLKADKGSSHNASSGHEKEDSIIFLSKNDLESMTNVCSNPQANDNFTNDRMKVFQPATKKSWFKNLRSKTNSYTHLDVQAAKCDGVDRYKDMSKLIQERFGNVEDDRPSETTPPRPSSEIGFKNGVSDTLQKSFSLQDLDTKILRPDILNVSEPQPDTSTPVKDKTGKPLFTDKLYSEFHVKTKQHSKSSSSLHQLLHLSKSKQESATTAVSKTHKDEERYPFEIKFERKDFPTMFEPHERQDDCSLTILDDLPYSSVRDSIIMQEEEERSVSPKAPSENIYAELFTDKPESVTSSDTKKSKRDSLSENRDVPNFHRISEINNSTRIRICLFNDDPNQTFTAKI
ncbi:uncharacterized protein LOC134829660 [Culicoides brevitarsis]|uniref:uncharacterized protein LOC134829660 n=1 Tax=Culicoides brevitarsis TaxID=469753 RepID=UPI00307B2C79